MNMRRLPIQDLVESRSDDLGISRSELARRCGFQNVNKGIRRIEQMLGGGLDSRCAKMILASLPMALKIEKEIIDSVFHDSVELIEQEKRRIADEQDAKLRASFKPNAYLIGSKSRPESIVIYGVTGGAERWLRIPLDITKPPITFAMQTLAFVRNMPRVPFWGDTTGYVINYSPIFAVAFDVKGNPIEVLREAYVPGRVQIEIGGRRMTGRGNGLFAK